MSDVQSKAQPVGETREQQLQNIEAVGDLFARAHDYIAQAQYPGHMGLKIAEVLNFLSFHHADFKRRADTLKKQMDSTVNVEEAKAAVAETLSDVATAVSEVPKA